ncbi:hypothetical protein GLT92_00575 [Nanohaloarchaea archaeon]|jgi:hypothetical protein|nr:hypothetical protein [Candidatus Nanohaloarchaea archaeon]
MHFRKARYLVLVLFLAVLIQGASGIDVSENVSFELAEVNSTIEIQNNLTFENITLFDKKVNFGTTNLSISTESGKSVEMGLEEFQPNSSSPFNASISINNQSSTTVKLNLNGLPPSKSSRTLSVDGEEKEIRNGSVEGEFSFSGNTTTVSSHTGDQSTDKSSRSNEEDESDTSDTSEGSGGTGGFGNPGDIDNEENKTETPKLAKNSSEQSQEKTANQTCEDAAALYQIVQNVSISSTNESVIIALNESRNQNKIQNVSIQNNRGEVVFSKNISPEDEKISIPKKQISKPNFNLKIGESKCSSFIEANWFKNLSKVPNTTRINLTEDRLVKNRSLIGENESLTLRLPKKTNKTVETTVYSSGKVTYSEDVEADNGRIRVQDIQVDSKNYTLRVKVDTENGSIVYTRKMDSMNTYKERRNTSEIPLLPVSIISIVISIALIGRRLVKSYKVSSSVQSGVENTEREQLKSTLTDISDAASQRDLELSDEYHKVLRDVVSEYQHSEVKLGKANDKALRAKQELLEDRYDESLHDLKDLRRVLEQRNIRYNIRKAKKFLGMGSDRTDR